MRVAISIVALLLIALIWRVLVRIDRRLRRFGGRLDAELYALHILATEANDPPPRTVRGVPPD